MSVDRGVEPTGVERAALVTGGTRGIGRAIVERLLAGGWRVATCGRQAPEQPIAAGGREAMFQACDVREPDQAAALTQACVERFGRLDLVVNNAGGSPQADAATASPRFSQAIVALNLMAPIFVSQAAHPHLKAARGSIVNIASVSATRPSPGTAVYGAAKAGLLSLTRSLAQEWGPDIRVNAIVVGLIETENAELTYGSAAAQRRIAQAIPAGRMGRGADIAEAAAFLASDAAAYISGAALEVDGGGEPPHFLQVVKEEQGGG